jgi:hypothetical protein
MMNEKEEHLRLAIAAGSIFSAIFLTLLLFVAVAKIVA